MRRVALAAALLAAAVLLSAPGGLTAQGIEGTVTFASTGQPAPGVLVAAFDGDRRVRASLTDAGGRYVLDVDPGRYRLVAERIGLSPTEIDDVVVDAAARTVRGIEMIDRPIELEGLVVDSRVRSCRTDARDADRVNGGGRRCEPHSASRRRCRTRSSATSSSSASSASGTKTPRIW